MAIAGVILAAGEGSRFRGRNKLLLPFRGRAVVYHVVRAALGSRLEPIILVIGHEGEKILAALAELASHPRIRVVENPDWPSGRASSVKTAIEALPKEARGALFLQGDMPLMTAQLIDSVAEGLLRTGAPLCFPLYNGEKGHPVAFSRELLRELATLTGDQSGWGVVKRHWAEAVKLPLRDGATQLDLDTPEDYAWLLELERR
ncbi:MAG: nucleotidyltransferase family protein [Candidatus Acetothermia bacterium]|jgi:molybdenum cofactor cytidylyltransferase|nr:nucleotidyltransferase family protein [Candidatus Acetothermia bacterium]MDH7504651.1 nucleotidyltransferase family protein [Candidatus Acetothermia bacterium]